MYDITDEDWLDEHLVRDHGRLPHEITGLPLRSVHDLEHFDESIGLIHLHHRHHRHMRRTHLSS